MPLIVQTSVKTVKSIGADVLFAMWTEMTRPLTVPVALHLDHCPERDVISLCLDKGWNSVLFDGSKLSVEDNKRQTIEVVAEASGYGALVEGEIEGFKRSRRWPTTSASTSRRSRPRSTSFARPGSTSSPRRSATPMACTRRRRSDNQRVTDIVEATGKPVALHGGTGRAPISSAT